MLLFLKLFIFFSFTIFCAKNSWKIWKRRIELSAPQAFGALTTKKKQNRHLLVQLSGEENVVNQTHEKFLHV